MSSAISDKQQSTHRYGHIFCDSLRASGSGFRFRHSHHTRTGRRSDSDGRSTTVEDTKNKVRVPAATDTRLYTHRSSPDLLTDFILLAVIAVVISYRAIAKG